jgi:hypothetical protein
VLTIITDVSEEHIASIFRVKYSESVWFAARLYLTADGEENLLPLHRDDAQSSLCVTE